MTNPTDGERSATPTCDAAAEWIAGTEASSEMVSANVARTLERDLTAARQRIDWFQKYHDVDVHNVLVLCGEDEGRGLRGAEKLRALIDGLITQRQRALAAESRLAAVEADAKRLDFLLTIGVAWHGCYDEDWLKGEWLYAQQDARTVIDSAIRHLKEKS